jgi:hypothetical protein
MLTGEKSPSRWKDYVGIALACDLAYVLIAPAISCGHLRVGDVVILAAPLGWGLIALFTYRDRKEQLVGWIAFTMGMLAAWITFE